MDARIINGDTIKRLLYDKKFLSTNCCCCLVTKSCPALFDPRDCSMPGFPVLHYLPDLLKLMSIESVMPSNHLVLCCPLLLPSSIFPSIRVFFSELALCVRWPKYWSLSFRISLSNEYSAECFSKFLMQ